MGDAQRRVDDSSRRVEDSAKKLVEVLTESLESSKSITAHGASAGESPVGSRPWFIVSSLSCWIRWTGNTPTAPSVHANVKRSPMASGKGKGRAGQPNGVKLKPLPAIAHGPATAVDGPECPPPSTQAKMLLSDPYGRGAFVRASSRPSVHANMREPEPATNTLAQMMENDPSALSAFLEGAPVLDSAVGSPGKAKVASSTFSMDVDMAGSAVGSGSGAASSSHSRAPRGIKRGAQAVEARVLPSRRVKAKTGV